MEAEKQRSREAEKQRSREAEKQRSREAEKQRSREAEKQRSRGFYVYLIAIHCLTLVLVFEADIVPKIKNELFPSSEVINPHGENMIFFHQVMDALVPDGAAVFLGDSITQGLAVSAVSPLSVNYGIGVATTTELLRNMPKYKAMERASVVFLMIGMNDIAQRRVDGLNERLALIASSIPSQVPLVWSGIMPTYIDKIDSAPVAPTNEFIEEICAARKNCTYIDTGKIFPANGADYFQDGLHPNEQGYSLWIDVLKESIEIEKAD